MKYMKCKKTHFLFDEMRFYRLEITFYRYARGGELEYTHNEFNVCQLIRTDLTLAGTCTNICLTVYTRGYIYTHIFDVWTKRINA